MSRTVFLVRHGQTGWNAEARYLGRTEVDLDETGVTEATRLGRWAAGARIDAVVTSPALRARRTADLVAEQVGLAPRVDDRLRELDFGMAEGRTLAELRAEDPELVARFEADPVRYHLPGGEDPHAAVARMWAALGDLTAPRSLLVTHNSVLRLVVCDCLRMPLAEYRRRLPLAEHCALTELTVTDGSVALRRFNAPLR